MGNPLQYLPINEALYGLLYGIQLPIHPPQYVPIYHAQEPTPRCLHPIVQNHWHNTKAKGLDQCNFVHTIFATIGLIPYLQEKALGCQPRQNQGPKKQYDRKTNRPIHHQGWSFGKSRKWPCS